MSAIRSFIAIELDETLLARLQRLQERLRQDIPSGLVRWARQEGIHLTLQFLGDVPESRIDAIAETLRDTCSRHAPIHFRVEGMGCFPNARRPRVIWVGVEEPDSALASLQRAITQANRVHGFQPEHRAFSPHLTLGRVRRGSADALRALGDYVSRSQVVIGQQTASAVHLIRSDLLPSGAVYTALAIAPLANAP